MSDHEITRAEANAILSAVAAGAQCSDELVTHCLHRYSSSSVFKGDSGAVVEMYFAPSC